MHQVQIDASLFTSNGSALGRISGPLTFDVVPRAGEILSFLCPPEGSTVSPSFASLLQPKVANVLHTPAPEVGVMLALEDIVAPSPCAAKQLVAYLAAGFNLFYEPYGDEAL